MKQLPNNSRRKDERGLVEHDQLGTAAAGKRAGELFFCSAREELKYALHCLFHFYTSARQRGTRGQILRYGQSRKELAPLGNLTDAEIADLVRIQAGDIAFGKNNPVAARSFDIGDGADQR